VSKTHRVPAEESHKILQAILAKAVEAIVTIDERGRILSINTSAERMFGYPAGQLVGQNVSVLMPSPDRERHDGYLRRYARTGEARIIGIGREVMARHRTGRCFPAELSVSEVQLSTGRIYAGFLRDITERKQAERILQTEFAATRLFTQSGFQTAQVPQLLRIICEGLAWDWGELWMPEAGGRRLRRLADWRGPGPGSPAFTAFVRSGARASVLRRRELPGRVWATGEPVWMRNLSPRRHSGLARMAARAGLRSAFAFPIKVDHAVHGVMVFYAKENKDPEPDLLSAMADLGIRIGSYIKRREAEDALRESEKRLQAIFDNAPTFFFLKSPEGRYLSANPHFEALCRRRSGPIEGCLDRDLFPRDIARALHDNVQEALELGKAVKFQISLPHPDGVRHYLATAFPLFNEAGDIYALCGIGTDMTELRQLEREILDISESEQRRIGQDLHDGLCQHLAGIEFISEALEQRLANRQAEEAATAGQIAGLMRDAIAHTRDLSKGLSPVILEPDGLMSALRLLADNIRKYFNIDCRFMCLKPVLVHDNNVATHLFRIAQEAVNNAIRHGEARVIQIQIATTTSRIMLAILDDGIGIGRTRPCGQGMGLRIMQYRSGMIGGSIVIQPDPAGGTSVTCSIHRDRLKPQRSKELAHEKGGKTKEG